MAALDVVGTQITESRTKDAVQRLFDGDGTVYLVSGFFTVNAYDTLRADIRRFLDRDPNNELVVVVGSGADQFSPSIAHDLWKLDSADQVRLYEYPDGFLHAKLYVRIGPAPTVILSSANLTRVAFEQNLELGAIIQGKSLDDPYVRPFVDWLDDLVAVCAPLTRRDLFAPLRLLTTLRNWSNKGRLLPARQAARRATIPMTLLALVVLRLFGIRFGF